MMNLLPAARTADIVIQELRNELLIADLRNGKAHCLNQTLATVYHACDGKTTFEDLQKLYNYPETLVILALRELKKEDLLKAGAGSAAAAGFSRRELIKRAGLSTIVALPIISSLAMPLAANAASGIIAPGSSCPSGFSPLPQSSGGGGGAGDFCTCPDPTPVGGSCSRGDITNKARCRTGCTCTVTQIDPGGGLRTGECN